jgi:hypothetical protein
MKAVGPFIAVSVLVFALSGCHNGSRPAPTFSVQLQYRPIPVITHNADGATVERIGLRKPILTPQGTIDVVYRITNVPKSRGVVFYVPCYSAGPYIDGGCAMEPIPGKPGLVVLWDGSVITVSNTTNWTQIKRWTPPPGERI